MTRERSLNVQAMTLALGSVAAQPLVAVLYVVTARGMDPAEYGLVVTTIALGMVGAGLIDFGSSPYWIRELASGRASLEQLLPKLAAKFLMTCAIAFLIVLVSALVNSHYVATGVLLLTSSAVVTVLVPLRAARRTELVGLLTALDRLVAVIAYFVQVTVGLDPGFALWISIAIGDFFLVIYVGTSEFIRKFPSIFRKLENPWAGAKWYSLNAFGASAQQLDLPLLALFGGATAAGIYGAVNRWTVPLAIATMSFTSAAAPYMAAQTSLRAVRSQILRATWMLAVVVLASSGAALAAPRLVGFLLGDAYANSTSVFQWLAGAMILNTIASPLLVALMSRQFDHLASVILTFSVGVQLSVVGALAASLGALSAAIGAFISQFLQIVISAGAIATMVWRRRRQLG